MAAGPKKTRSHRKNAAAQPTTLWVLAKDGDTVVGVMRPLASGAVQLLSTLNGETFYSRVFRHRKQFLSAARKIRSMMNDQGWISAEPAQDMALDDEGDAAQRIAIAS